MERIIFHIDVNNAFVSWTAVDLLRQGSKIDIRNTYAVVGGDEKTRNGIVLAKSPLAKKVGIVTGETIYNAKRKYKNLTVYPPNFRLYQEMSYSLFNLLAKYTPDIEVASIDECYLDYGKVKKLYGDELEFAYKIKDEIQNTLGFTVNIGIANNKLCAKMASDFTKPNRVHTLYDNEIKEKMWPLKVGDLFGVGRSTLPKLEAIGIHTIEDLANYDLTKLTRYFKNQAKRMIDFANGIGSDVLETERTVTKGLSNSVTLPHNLVYIEDVYDILESISENLSSQLRREKRYAYVVRVFLDFFKKGAYIVVSELFYIITDIFYRSCTRAGIVGAEVFFITVNRNEQAYILNVGLSFKVSLV